MLFGAPEQGELLNTAVLDGRTVAVPIAFRALYNDGTSAAVSSGLACSSDVSEVIKVRPDCASLRLDGSELSGADQLIIYVTLGLLLQTEIPVTV